MAVLAAALSIAGCKNATEAAPETGADYYPVAVGNYWVYAVADTTWSQASGQLPTVTPSVPTASAYEFRETVTEVFTDAAGQPAYRLVRAKRVPPATAFRDDSVFVLRATPQSVVLIRNNAPTLELLFPVRDGRVWNFNAYNNLNDTTRSDQTRRASNLGQPFTTRATPTKPAQTYPATLLTTNTGGAAQNDRVARVGYQQVFAKGIGPVYRRRDHFIFYSYATATEQVYPPGAYALAFTRRETLVDYGPR